MLNNFLSVGRYGLCSYGGCPRFICVSLLNMRYSVCIVLNGAPNTPPQQMAMMVSPSSLPARLPAIALQGGPPAKERSFQIGQRGISRDFEQPGFH